MHMPSSIRLPFYFYSSKMTPARRNGCSNRTLCHDSQHPKPFGLTGAVDKALCIAPLRRPKWDESTTLRSTENLPILRTLYIFRSHHAFDDQHAKQESVILASSPGLIHPPLEFERGFRLIHVSGQAVLIPRRNPRITGQFKQTNMCDIVAVLPTVHHRLMRALSPRLRTW